MGVSLNFNNGAHLRRTIPVLVAVGALLLLADFLDGSDYIGVDFLHAFPQYTFLKGPSLQVNGAQRNYNPAASSAFPGVDQTDVDLEAWTDFADRGTSFVQTAAGLQNGTAQFRVTDFELDPGKVTTDLALKIRDWGSETVFVVSVTRNLRRLSGLDSQLSSLGVNYSLVLAPDSEQIDLTPYADLLTDSQYRENSMTGIELDRALGHVELWAHVVSKRLPYVLVFEEDVILEQSFQEVFERALKQLNLLKLERPGFNLFDLCMLGSWDRYAVLLSPDLTQGVRQTDRDLPPFAYLLSLGGAHRLLENIALNTPLEEAIFRVHQAYTLAVGPITTVANPFSCKSANCRFSEKAEPAPSNETFALKSHAGVLNLTQISSLQWGEIGPGIKRAAEDRRKGRTPWPPLPKSLLDWPVFVVSLVSTPGRMEAMKARMVSAGFGEVKRALAVDVTSTELATFKHLIANHGQSETRVRSGTGRGAWFLSKGEVGCALSHFRIWDELVARGVPYALILEDDVTFNSNFTELFHQNLRELQSFLDSGHEMSRFDIVYVGREGILSASAELPMYTPHIHFSGISWGSWGYIISLPGAQKLLRNFIIDDPIDAIWLRVPRMRFLTFEPTLVAPGTGASTVGPHGVDKAWI